MAELDREFLRTLTAWRSDRVPVSSLYLDVDGRRFPRKKDYEVRLDQLCDRLVSQAEGEDRRVGSSVSEDTRRIREFVGSLDRSKTRGVAIFSCAAGGLWEQVLLPASVRDRSTLADRPYVLPLEALVEMYQTFCTALVDREKARLFLARMGLIREVRDVRDDVPNRHDQGGWSQARFQRHVDGHAEHHLKHVAEVLMALLKRRGFDHLILAGSESVLPGFERSLHDYLKRRIVARIHLPMTAGSDEVLARSLEIEESLEQAKEADAVERLRAQAAAGRQAVTGLSRVLEALGEGRVETLIVPPDVQAEGVRCSACGRLATRGRKCRFCGGSVEPVVDLVDAAVAAAIQQSAQVETLSFSGSGGANGQELGALLRY